MKLYFINKVLHSCVVPYTYNNTTMTIQLNASAFIRPQHDANGCVLDTFCTDYTNTLLWTGFLRHFSRPAIVRSGPVFIKRLIVGMLIWDQFSLRLKWMDNGELILDQHSYSEYRSWSSVQNLCIWNTLTVKSLLKLLSSLLFANLLLYSLLTSILNPLQVKLVFSSSLPVSFGTEQCGRAWLSWWPRSVSKWMILQIQTPLSISLPPSLSLYPGGMWGRVVSGTECQSLTFSHYCPVDRLPGERKWGGTRSDKCFQKWLY